LQNGTLPESITTHAYDARLPASSVKPEYKGKPTLLNWLTGSARTFRCPVVLGIRDVSRTLEFRASYTLVEHAPTDSIELEIKPYALSEIEKVRAAQAVIPARGRLILRMPS
jgi:hypothetical protein